ncbi:hypothetical protein MSAN_00816600 [Mycena sanguinolenta]|uniref:Uncharacterized protein n=1 Tax=Mycena sanguinolenta TaxID=230812 RepID=A0A8H6Z0B1_9AGAR|nr:hypothetical protein MSAN_00816600 [Mycena sanguinolenta]
MPRSQTLIFYGLNATRVLSIVALLLVFSSSILVMVTNVKAVDHFQAERITNSTDIMLDCDYIEGSTVPNQPAGVFWAVVASLLIIFQVIILLLSEIGWPAVFFDTYFPVLGRSFGVGALGIFQCLCYRRANPFAPRRRIHSCRCVLRFLCRLPQLPRWLDLPRKRQDQTLSPWRRRCEQDLYPSVRHRLAPDQRRHPFAFTGDADAVSYASWKASDMTKAAYGFGRQAEKAAALRDVEAAQPEENLPRYPSPTPSDGSKYSQHTKSASATSHEDAHPQPAAEWYPAPMFAHCAPEPVPRSVREPRAPSPRSHRARGGLRPPPARSTASSRSASSDSRSSAASSVRPETPDLDVSHSPSRYGRNHGAF